MGLLRNPSTIRYLGVPYSPSIEGYGAWPSSVVLPLRANIRYLDLLCKPSIKGEHKVLGPLLESPIKGK